MFFFIFWYFCLLNLHVKLKCCTEAFFVVLSKEGGSVFILRVNDKRGQKEGMVFCLFFAQF